MVGEFPGAAVAGILNLKKSAYVLKNAQKS
jgi:hypothetical protein